MDRDEAVMKLRLKVMPTGNVNDLCKDTIIGLTARFHSCKNAGPASSCRDAMRKQAMRSFKQISKEDGIAAGSKHCKELFVLASRP